MKKKTYDNIRMGSELRAFSKVNNIFNEYVLQKLLKVQLKIMLRLDDADAAELSSDLFENKRFKRALLSLQYRAQKSAITNGIALAKTAIAFIPGAGPAVGLGVDAVTKWIPQAFYILLDIKYFFEQLKPVLAKYRSLIERRRNALKQVSSAIPVVTATPLPAAAAAPVAPPADDNTPLPKVGGRLTRRHGRRTPKVQRFNRKMTKNHKKIFVRRDRKTRSKK